MVAHCETLPESVSPEVLDFGLRESASLKSLEGVFRPSDLREINDDHPLQILSQKTAKTLSDGGK